MAALRELPAAEVDAALTRLRSGDVYELAYLAACRAIHDYCPDLSPTAGPDDYAADYDYALWNSVEEAVIEAGYDPDKLDLYGEVEAARANANAATMVAFDGGGSEDYAAARAFMTAANYTPPPEPVTHPPTPVMVCSTRHRRESGARPAHRRGSRRVTRAGPSSDDDPDDPEPPGLRLWRHSRFGNCSPKLLRVLVEAGR